MFPGFEQSTKQGKSALLKDKAQYLLIQWGKNQQPLVFKTRILPL